MSDYFEGCPVCGRSDTILHLGREHWGFCPDHELKWHIGSNLFSGWHEQTPARRALYEIILGNYVDVTGGPQ